MKLRPPLALRYGLHVDDAQLRVLFAKYDANGDGTIDPSEFCKSLLPVDYPENGVKPWDDRHGHGADDGVDERGNTRGVSARADSMWANAGDGTGQVEAWRVEHEAATKSGRHHHINVCPESFKPAWAAQTKNLDVALRHRLSQLCKADGGGGFHYRGAAQVRARRLGAASGMKLSPVPLPPLLSPSLAQVLTRQLGRDEGLTRDAFARALQARARRRGRRG